MKTAISIPDHLYKKAEKTAKAMGIPRSQLFAKALEEFINHHEKEKTTEKLNAIYTKTTTPSDFSHIATASLDSIRELTKNDAW